MVARLKALVLALVGNAAFELSVQLVNVEIAVTVDRVVTDGERPVGATHIKHRFEILTRREDTVRKTLFFTE